MKNRLELIIEGNGLKALGAEERERERCTTEATIQALRERAQNAERDASVFGGMVDAMKQILVTQWEQKEKPPLQEKLEMLERNQKVWEAEAATQKGRASALERQLQGKDETIQALRAQLKLAPK